MVTTMLISQPDPSPASFPAALAGPSYMVGQDAQGHWLAVETHGSGGGFFRSEAAALRYAQDETDDRPGAVLVTAERLSLRL